MNENADRVERDVVIAATSQRVWEVLTTPEHVGTWFGTGSPIAIDLRPGGEMVLDHGANGRYRTVFVEVDPPHRLSYRWAEGYPDTLASETNSTLVEFTITPLSEHETRLAVVESGFSTLVVPEGREWISYEGHNRGWTDALANACAYAEGRDSTHIMSVQ
ncbi:MAG: polyketide cyclase [Acidobacteria bacterium]|nr:polyketide cyclase [Acidobacteriota bacterium]